MIVELISILIQTLILFLAMGVLVGALGFIGFIIGLVILTWRTVNWGITYIYKWYKNEDSNSREE